MYYVIVMIQQMIVPLISLKKAFAAVACIGSYAAKTVAAATCPENAQDVYANCIRNSQDIGHLILRITEKQQNSDAFLIAEYLEYWEDVPTSYWGYAALMECFRDMAQDDDPQSVRELGRLSASFVRGYDRLPCGTRLFLNGALHLQKNTILSIFEVLRPD